MKDGARTQELADAFVRYLDSSGLAHYASDARELARDLARACNSGSCDARSLALAEVRDTARDLRLRLERARKHAGKAYTLAGDDLDFVSDASPWIGQARLSEAQHANSQARQRYSAHAGACAHLRGIIRGIERDLAHEAAAARARGVSRLTSTSRRLVEPAPGLPARERAERRRRRWSDLDELACAAHPRRAQLGYVVGVLLGQRE